MVRASLAGQATLVLKVVVLVGRWLKNKPVTCRRARPSRGSGGWWTCDRQGRGERPAQGEVADEGLGTTCLCIGVIRQSATWCTASWRGTL